MKLPDKVARRFGRQLLQIQKYSPTILFGAGVVGVVGSTVLACRATLKLDEVLLDTQRDLAMAKAMDHEDYTDQDRSRDVALIYTRATVSVVKLYAPSVILGSASIGALTSSHRTLTRRNAALTAAYAAVEKGFSEYRRRVVDEFGEQKDREFRYGVETVAVVNEDTNRKKMVHRVSGDTPSMYARFFDQFSGSWSKEPEYNLLFLRCQQNYANDLLKSRGHVFLNEVYDMLGMERSKAGAVVGWIIGYDSDNFIDFGIFDSHDQARDFVNGREGSILLDFNVDGVIFDKLDEYAREERVAWQSD